MCPAPTLQGPDFFKTLLPTSKQATHVPEDPSLNTNCRKACCVSLLINFVDAGRNKNVTIFGELVQDLGNNFGF